MVLARWQATIQDGAGNIVEGAQVTVRREIAGAPLVSIYADRNGTTPLGNPFTVGPDGLAAFHAPGGAYSVDAVKGAFSQVWRYVPIGLAQESDSLTTGLSWTFSAATADADPGEGLLRFNNAALVSVSQIFLDNLNAFAADVSAWLDTFDDFGAASDRGIIVLQTVDGAGLFVGRVTGSIVNGTGYRKVSVVPIVSAGAFGDGARVSLFFTRSGKDGADAVQPGLVFAFNNATAMADPGAGAFRLNNATLGSVTAAAFSDLSALAGNPDVSAAVLSWDDSTNAANRGTLLVKKIAAPQNFALFRISGASVDNAGWTQLALALVAGAGSFANGDLCSVEFSASASAAVAASETVAGIVEMATDAEIRSAATGALAVMAEDIKTASVPVALVDAATVALDWNAGINFTLTAAGNRVIGNPTNGQPGTWRTILVQGNDATARTITFGAVFLGEVPTITDCTSTKWYLLTIYCVNGGHFLVSAKRALG